MPDVEVVAGTGQRCFPHEKSQCNDGRIGTEVQLLYPKDLTFGLDGSLFFAYGNVIRMMDSNGFVRKIVGQWNKRQWKPISCKVSHASDDVRQ